jgi:hypothetical protein
MQRMLEIGQVPDYMIGASFGSVLGAVVGRALPVPIEEYVAWAKTVSYRAILGCARTRRRHGLTGLFSLRFDQFADAMFRREDGERMRMSDMAIPFDAVVAGCDSSPSRPCPRGSAVNSSRHCGCGRSRTCLSASVPRWRLACGRLPRSSTRGW